ncbi:hypothetical protein TIFTF001_007323 [Ficus carica]|uniref:Uncharacterized protein n=1 Tax=Ficus carica TaxID=3494 RepID=A0AA88A2R7_FICCA|nr:hypothetical protein TIFTF001_007323 [Ficus carica]
MGKSLIDLRISLSLAVDIGVSSIVVAFTISLPSLEQICLPPSVTMDPELYFPEEVAVVRRGAISRGDLNLPYFAIDHEPCAREIANLIADLSYRLKQIVISV